jgi:hypothetical protein
LRKLKLAATKTIQARFRADNWLRLLKDIHGAKQYQVIEKRLLSLM